MKFSLAFGAVLVAMTASSATAQFDFSDCDGLVGVVKANAGNLADDGNKCITTQSFLEANNLEQCFTDVDEIEGLLAFQTVCDEVAVIVGGTCDSEIANTCGGNGAGQLAPALLVALLAARLTRP